MNFYADSECFYLTVSTETSCPSADLNRAVRQKEKDDRLMDRKHAQRFFIKLKKTFHKFSFLFDIMLSSSLVWPFLDIIDILDKSHFKTFELLRVWQNTFTFTIDFPQMFVDKTSFEKSGIASYWSPFDASTVIQSFVSGVQMKTCKIKTTFIPLLWVGLINRETNPICRT